MSVAPADLGGPYATKACSTCCAEKPLDEFGADRRRRDGRRSQCNECRRAAYAEAVGREMPDGTMGCDECGEEKPLVAFPLRLAGTRRQPCRSCVQAGDREGSRRRGRRYTRRLRLAALAAYGGACACCGEGEEVYLVIDHVQGGGSKHRRSITGGIFAWLKRHSYPPGFQVLCHNCNHAKRLGGCPAGAHEGRRAA